MRHSHGELVGGRLDDIDLISLAMRDIAEESGLFVLHSYFHKFEPQGVTGVLVISESHFTIHTWPEKNYAAVDFFTCGEQNTQEAILKLAAALGSMCEIKTYDRWPTSFTP